ncbi:MAG: GvpL/GvpF family gas vesicle protein [Pseudomonadota bacterium]
MSKPQLLVYGITHRDASPLREPQMGLGNRPVQIGLGSTFGLLFSRHTALEIDHMLQHAAPDWAELVAADYLSAVNRLSHAYDLLPVRFGTVLSEIGSLDAYLTANYTRIASGLDNVRGHQEWTIKLSMTPSCQKTEGPPQAKDYLRACQQQRLVARRQYQAFHQMRRSLSTQLCAHADMVILAPADVTCAGNVADTETLRLLCRRDSGGELMALIKAELAQAPFLQVQVIGPEAPFFTARSIEGADAA